MKQGIKIEKERHKIKRGKKELHNFTTPDTPRILQHFFKKKSNNIRKENFWKREHPLSLNQSNLCSNNSEPSRFPQKSATQ
jgi:hypothetical protein